MVYSIDTINAKSIPLSITRAALKKAQQFASLQPTAEKQRQVYYNTLAVCVVNDYMQMMQIPTDLQASDSWNQVLRLAADVADLMLPGLGHLECRAVTPESLQSNTPICYIPPEVPDDRIGIVVVSLEPEFQQATLLGFSKIVETTELAISQLQTIDDLLEYLESLSETHQATETNKTPIVASETHKTTETNETPIVERLSQWFEKQIETGWQSVESLLSPQTVKMAWSFREFREAVTIGEKTERIDLGRPPMPQLVELVVKFPRIPTDEMEVTVGVQPYNDQTYLPEGLQLAILDEGGATAMAVSTEGANKNIQSRFSCEREEHFSVKVTLGDVSVTKHYVI
ncbi:MAG: hypothetical protein CLLPBCKN_007091 [Chroococcidiopsis cubana SAG 39.79]|uniref:DUF1822 domain-containing protein n=1 Tax=Chroococcidiopsis cubana SAG 39.79 TaxID=388085 RepID=A0AB37UBI3_9CYAN|nr:DUF1822 family protein [Chroococcidiopsis cubana]MDZ4877656.1 hypothetical protein [Chroococcidiopsis cubana SAG 39.79]PSB63548.1 hypothetical protein C7B79_13450 [Chroococcidiopsis cubana CCALA 043]RUT04555.1 hypothetical protein DSM107010_57350 [Chroococcidiopsis cubana SAG 39.79]